MEDNERARAKRCIALLMLNQFVVEVNVHVTSDMTWTWQRESLLHRVVHHHGWTGGFLDM